MILCNADANKLIPLIDGLCFHGPGRMEGRTPKLCKANSVACLIEKLNMIGVTATVFATVRDLYAFDWLTEFNFERVITILANQDSLAIFEV